MTHYRAHFDRTDWRTMDTRALVEAARDSGHELAIALGERLEELDDADDALQEAREESRAKGERGVITLERLMREHGKGR